MQYGCARGAQERNRSSTNYGRQYGGGANTAISNRERVLQPRFQTAVGFVEPLRVDGEKALGLLNDLCRPERNRFQFLLGKITAAGAQIGASVAENISQLQAHPVLLAEREHLFCASPRKISQMSKAKPGPEFADAAGDEISVLIKLGGSSERAQFGWVGEALQIQALPARNFVKESAHFVAVRRIKLIDLSECFR